jgi:hypothetical protein
MKTKIFKPSELDSKSTKLESIYGNCLKALNIELSHGGWVVTNRTLAIREGDLVQCTRMPSTLPYIMKVQKIDDETVIVDSCYGNSQLDFNFEAAEIYGVVTHIFDKQSGTELYRRPKLAQS